MGCCFGKEKGATLSGGGGGNRFSQLSPTLTLPEGGGDLSGSGGEGSPGESEARQARFKAYYGSSSAEEISLRELRRGVVKFNQNFRQVRQPRRPCPVLSCLSFLQLSHAPPCHSCTALPHC
jgi:hypothetical protein